MLIGELINNLAQKAGVLADNDELKSLLASPELAAVKVPETLGSTIERTLLSIDAAKNNHPDIKNKYMADFYDGMDKRMLKAIESDTFDNDDLEEIKAEKSTTKRYDLIISKLKAAKSAAKGADKEEINRQLAAVNESARLAKLEVETVKNNYEAKIKDINKRAALKAVFANYKTIYDELPAAIKVATMESLINNALQDKNAELKTDDNGNLQLLSKDGSNVFGSNHVQLTPQSFLDQSFAPILKVSGPPKSQQQQIRQPIPPVKTGDQEDANTGFLKSINDQVLQDMAVPKASMI